MARLHPKTCGATAMSRFMQNKSGNFAVISVLASLPMIMALGGAMDMAAFYHDRQIIQAAADAAALAAAKAFPSEPDKTKLAQIAKTYFLANTSGLLRTKAEMTYDGAEFSDDGERKLTVSSCSEYSPYFLTSFKVSFPGMKGNGCIKTDSVVIVSNTTVEIAMVLDTSGSMLDPPAAGSGSKIETLRSRAGKAVTSLFGSGAKTGDDDPVRVAVVPFSGSVNVGPSHLNDWWMDPKGLSDIHHENLDWSSYKVLGLQRGIRSPLYPDLDVWVDALDPLRYLTRQDVYKQLSRTYPKYAFKGCVEAREAPYGLTDDVPTEKTPNSLFVPYFAPDEGDNLKKGWVNNYLTDTANGSFDARTTDVNKYYASAIFPSNAMGANNSYSPSYICDSNALQPLSPSKDATLSTINGLVASGSTNVDQGIGWGWRVLSKNEPFTEGRASGDENNIKAMIVMTDGENTYYQDNQNTTNKNETAFGSYGFAATGRIFDYKTTSVKTKSNTNYTAAMEARTSIVCENAKSDGKVALKSSSGATMSDERGVVMRDGILIYTIAFDIPAASKTRVDALLKSCASYKLGDLRNTKLSYSSKTKYFYSAANDAQLDQAFSDIMASLSQMRIAH